MRGAVVVGEVRFAGAPGAGETTRRDAAPRIPHNDPQGRKPAPAPVHDTPPTRTFGYALTARPYRSRSSTCPRSVYTATSSDLINAGSTAPQLKTLTFLVCFSAFVSTS
jgi:hypothetical protein